MKNNNNKISNFYSNNNNVYNNNNEYDLNVQDFLNENNDKTTNVITLKHKKYSLLFWKLFNVSITNDVILPYNWSIKM